MKIFDRFIKKKELIHDGGVHQRGNHVDVVIISLCVVVTLVLIYLTTMAYIVS